MGSLPSKPPDELTKVEHGAHSSANQQLPEKCAGTGIGVGGSRSLAGDQERHHEPEETKNPPHLR